MPELSRRRRFLVLAICCASILVVVMDISIVNVALPAIRRELHASVTGLQWTVDAYTLVLASFLVLSGSVADRVGRRRVFQIGLAAFGAGSLLCGLAPGIGWLIAARALQAVGGTMLNPVAMAIVANTFPEPVERARAIGVFGSVSGLALALGPILGGALVDGLGWRSIFWVNVPIVAAAIASAAVFVPESRAARPRRFDPVGQALVVLVLASVVYAIIESRWLGWTSPVILVLLALAVLGTLGILGYEPRRADPLLELCLFRSVPFTSAILMALGALCAFGAFLFVTTLYLQEVRGLPALTAGLCLLPVGLMVLVLSPVTGRVVGARGPRPALAVSGAALALGGFALFWVGPATGLPAVLAAYLLFGIFLGTVNPPITNTAVSGMPRSMAAVASSLASAGRQGGTTLGVAISGTIVGSALARGGTAFTNAAHAVWWMVLVLGAGIGILGVLSTGRWAAHTAARAAALFEEVDRGANPPAAPLARRLPGIRAQIAQDALVAPGPLRPAHRAAMGDQREVQVVADIRRDARGEQLMCPVRAGARRDPAEPRGDPVHVGVDRERGTAHREDEHAGGGLRAHARKRPQVCLRLGIAEVIEAREVDAALAVIDGGQDLLDAAGLLIGDPAAADGVGHLTGRRVQNLFPGREPLLQPPERPLGVHVRGVLGQHGRDDLVDDREPRLRAERALAGPQPPLHRPDPPRIGALGLRCHLLAYAPASGR